MSCAIYGILLNNRSKTVDDASHGLSPVQPEGSVVVPNAHLKLAANLVGIARATVPSYHLDLAQRFPVLSPVYEGDWMFFTTVAAVWSASATINIYIPDNQQSEVRAYISRDLAEWHPGAVRAIHDLTVFIANGAEDEPQPSYLPAAVGLWIVWNLFGREPSDSECWAGSAIGNRIVDQFTPYWAALNKRAG